MSTSYITKTPEVCGGRPCVDGHRVRVQDIAAYSEWRGWQPDRIASEFDLSLSQVHAALAYYFDNIEEIREDLRRDLAENKRAKANSNSKVAQKLAALSDSETKSA